MLADVEVDEVSDMQTDKGTSTAEIQNALNWYGIKTVTKTRKKYVEGTELHSAVF